jgi:hypothetical protein
MHSPHGRTKVGREIRWVNPAVNSFNTDLRQPVSKTWEKRHGRPAGENMR